MEGMHSVSPTFPFPRAHTGIRWHTTHSCVLHNPYEKFDGELIAYQHQQRQHLPPPAEITAEHTELSNVLMILWQFVLSESAALTISVLVLSGPYATPTPLF